MTPFEIDPFSSYLGLRWEDSSTIRLTIRPELVNSVGRLLGPVGFAMVDYGMASALYETLQPGESMATDRTSRSTSPRRRTQATSCAGRASIAVAAGRGSSARRWSISRGRVLATAIGTFAIIPASGEQ